MKINNKINKSEWKMIEDNYRIKDVKVNHNPTNYLPKKFLILITFLMILLLTISLTSAYMRSNVNFGLGSSFSTGSGLGFNKDMCEAGQDFIVQIMPFGCTPQVVRSDLLEEQNVPVFCQLAATKLNPMIKVEAIESISFKGGYPEGISGVGFHPAQAALGVKGDMNNPILNNIGYVVIVLDQQKDASKMPESIEGTLTAKLKYDIQNAFGVGKASFYLPEIDDIDWEQKKNQYSFWKGKGFLKAESIDQDSAKIGIYDGTRRIASVDLKKGETSREITLPTMDQCLTRLKVKLNSFENPTTRAKLNINGDTVEVGDEEKFLDGKCQVTDLKKQGLIQKVDIKCKEDDSVESFSLKISPKVILKIKGTEREYVVGDKIYDSSDGEKEVFLGFIGTKGNSGKQEDLYVRFVQAPLGHERLTENMLEEVASFDGGDYVDKSFIGKISLGSWDYLKRFTHYLIDGSEISDAYNYKLEDTVVKEVVDEDDSISTSDGVSTKDKLYGISITVIKLAEPFDISIKNKDSESYYNLAKEDFDNIKGSFSSEEYGGEILGEEAFLESILLANLMGQKKRAKDLCIDFKEEYPSSDYVDGLLGDGQACDDIKLSNSEIAIKEVSINGVVKKISFEEVNEPDTKDFSAEIKIINAGEYSGSPLLQKNQMKLISDEGESIILKELTSEYVVLDVRVNDGNLKNVLWKTTQVKIKLGELKVIGKNNYQIKVNKINLKKSAKVSIIPSINNAGTEANFSFKIGIEQRAIKLSPEKTKEKITNLEETIKEWESKSESLGKAVKGFKAACLATSAGLMVKNFFANTGGKAIARKDVMRMDGGWNDKCKAMIPQTYSTLDECFIKESDNIDDDVDVRYNNMQTQQERIKQLENQAGTEPGIFGDKIVKTDKFTELYFDDIQKDLASKNSVTCKDGTIDIGSGSTIYNSFTVKDGSSLGSISDARSVQLGLMELNGDKGSAELCSKLIDIENTNKVSIERESLQQELNTAGFGNVEVHSYGNKDAVQGIYSGQTITSNQITGLQKPLESTDKDGRTINHPIEIITYSGKKYVVILRKTSSTDYVPDSFYEYEGVTAEGIQVGNKADGLLSTFKTFKKYDKDSYKNPYKNAELTFYETEPYKGYPAIVPFDKTHGWYVSIKQTLPIGTNIKSFDASGRLSSFYLCNVGKNGNEENRGGDDICQMVNLATEQTYSQFNGLSGGDTTKFVRCAVAAVQDAQTQRQRNSKISGTVRIKAGSCGSIDVKVGKPAVDVPDIQCQDFMSPSDCNLMFNVCDPVVCPSSRCDFGGTYPVQDVIQTGIVGGALLCLPNIKEKIYVPVCLSGIKAGVDGYLSILQSHQDCLQESLDSGEVVGVCDEIYSVYACEFFWRQALPLTKMIIPKVMELALGQNVRGGGEYLGVQSAWESAGESVDYFTQYYAADSFKAFKARSVEQTGSDLVCKNSISGVYPGGEGLFDALIEPDSPPQFHGRFDEIFFTDVTNPPISQYKVFYHIYAGKDSRATYRVYLKGDSGSSFYQDTASNRQVASGYIPTGEYASETLDFTAPSGYTELCINVNGQEECGFKEVSTSFAVNYVKDKYLEEQALKKDIKTESSCISGSASAYSLLNPSVQGAAEDLANPALYKRGIIRICATENPGKGTDANAERNGSRWVDVGYCGDKNMRCWLDENSVKDVIKNTDIEGNVLSEQNEAYRELLESKGIYLDEATTDNKIREIEKAENDPNKVIKLVKEIFDKVFMNNQKAKLLLERGKAYGKLAEEGKPPVAKSSGGETIEEKSAEEMKEELNKLGVEDIDKLTDEQIKTMYDSRDIEESVLKCEDCNDIGIPGFLGFWCSEDKCKKIGELSKTNCIFTDSPLLQRNLCKEGEKIEEEVDSGTSEVPFVQKSCQQQVGDLILQKAKSMKGSDTKFSDSTVEEQTGVESFECLVLQLAMQESSLTHCSNNPDDCISCGEDLFNVYNSGGEESYGVMQLNLKYFEEENAMDFNKNVEDGINHLIGFYNDNPRSYSCSGNENNQYSGWKRALRNYNGWSCSGGNINHVENVINQKSKLSSFGSFPECA